MDSKEIYDKSYSFLVKEASIYNITKEMIDDFITKPDFEKCNGVNPAFELLLFILQDYSMNSKVIQFKSRKNTIISSLLNDNKIDLEYIASLPPEELFSKFNNE
ncbi:MAG: hypothetical protein IKR21_01245, partial [Oscillospiraceae bacterium]|nr:hypothetical protein [Oscillospiraceae bacterium]